MHHLDRPETRVLEQEEQDNLTALLMHNFMPNSFKTGTY